MVLVFIQLNVQPNCTLNDIQFITGIEKTVLMPTSPWDVHVRLQISAMVCYGIAGVEIYAIILFLIYAGIEIDDQFSSMHV